MRALTVKKAGDRPELRSCPIPEPGPGQVRLRVTATALNFADLLMIRGTYQETPPFPLVPGLEVAGVADALGDGVEGPAIGTRVAAETGHGGLAEFALVDANRTLALPDTMSDDVGAAFQIAYGTSHLALIRRARLISGERLVVLGAAGGVGLTAVEIGKAVGADVVAVARGAERLNIAQAAGADLLIDSDVEPDLRGRLKDIGPVHVVYDAVGGLQGEDAMRALVPEGRHLLIGFASGDVPKLKPNHMMVKNIEAIGVYWGGYRKFQSDAMRDSLTTLFDWHARGLIRPHIGARFTLDNAQDALDALASRQVTGKIIVTP